MPHLPLAALVGLALATASAHAVLIAHYTFDVDNSGSTPDSVGSATATLGNRVEINNTVADRIGGGALEMLGGGFTVGTGDGATTSNSFSWSNDARTVTFWWRAKDTNVNTSDGTFVSFGDNTANGTRFEIKEQQPGVPNHMLRVEVQGAGLGTNPSNFDNAGDGVARPPGGPAVTFSTETVGATTTVTATTNESVPQVFFRAGVRQLP